METTTSEQLKVSAALAQAAPTSLAPAPASAQRLPWRDAGKADFFVTVGFLGDAVMIMVGLSIGFWIRFRSGLIQMGNESADLRFADYSGLILVGTLFLLATFGALNLYTARKALRFRQVASVMLKGATLWLFGYLGLSLALKFDPTISRIYVACSYLACLGTLLGWRYLLQRVMAAEPIARHLRQRILIVGWSDDAQRLSKVISNDREHYYDVVGTTPPAAGRYHKPPPADVKQIGTYESLSALLQEYQIDIVLFADTHASANEIIALSNLCEREFVQFKVIPSYFQILLSALHLESISGVPILGVTELPLSRLHNRFLKRCVDIAGSIVGLIVSSPIIGICGTLVYLESPGSIFYRQKRMGRNGKVFEIIKLRSMRLDAEHHSGPRWAEKDDPRRLKIGAFMREWNLDEVPQFWNVLKGEMSLVGPRPERPELIEGFKQKIPHYNARHASKPGITGWAQVNGFRGDTSLVERVRYDLFYLENWNLWLDCHIMIQTFFKRENAY